LTITQFADVVQSIPRPLQAQVTEYHRDRHFDYFLEYLVVCDIKEKGEQLPADENKVEALIKKRKELYMVRIKNKEFEELLQSSSFWIVLLHNAGVKGKGRVSVTFAPVKRSIRSLTHA
jgi:hypothetical protein